MGEDSDQGASDAAGGGWVLVARDAAAITSDLKAYAQVFRFPVSDGSRTRGLGAGQPCFLFVEDAGDAVKPGIWAVGEVVAEVTERADGSLVAEVELLPLQERIGKADLAEHEVLAGSELFGSPVDDRQPLPLSRDEVRALEEWDFDLRPPTPEQEANLTLVLAEIDAELDELYGS